MDKYANILDEQNQDICNLNALVVRNQIKKWGYTFWKA